jgi:phosphotransacetylase
MTEPRRHEKYQELIFSRHALAPLRTIVAHPCNESSLRPVIEATAAKIIKPILVGPEARIRAIDAAALCKMAERGQIAGGVLDGPFALDNAISSKAVAAKHINSPVAGDADILLVPDLEAGTVLGARVPVILTSGADSVRTRTASVLSPRSAPPRAAGPRPISASLWDDA